MTYITRTQEGAIRAHLSRPEITVILGPRQVGKTTLMKKLRAELKEKAKPTGFYNLDIDVDADLFESQQRLVDALRLEFAERPAVIFVDEIQRKRDAGLFLKGLYDRDLPYKFVVSGSGSLELKEKVVESLAGRKRVFLLMPLSFREFFDFKTAYQYGKARAEVAKVYSGLMDGLFREYMVFGGYPKVVLAENREEKRAELQEIFLSYLDRDVATIIGVGNPYAYQRLMRLMAQRVGHFVNYSGLAVLSRLTSPTVRKYLWYLEKTFMIHCIPPFYTNPEKEIVKSPVCYFTDMGMANLGRRDFEVFSNDTHAGMMFQNFIFLLLQDLLANTFTALKTWRSKSKAEVDFVLDTADSPIPVEVKFADYDKASIPASLKSFIRTYQPSQAFIVNKSKEYRLNHHSTEIRVLPYWKLEDALREL